MKAVLKEDIIIRTTRHGDVEIGAIPKSVGIERLRFDGSNLIDLSDLNEIWVRHIGGAFELHAISVYGAQLVQMTWAERSNLKIDDGTIRLKTAIEIQQEETAKHNKLIKNILRKQLHSSTGQLEDQLQNAIVLICALIVYARTGNAQIEQFFDLLVPEIKDTFPLDKVQPIIMKHMKDLKIFMDEYWQNIIEE